MSKRAEKLFHKIRPYQPIGDVKAKEATPSADEAIALIDAELRKAVEATVDHVLQDWLCYDDETNDQHQEYNAAHRGHLIEGGLARLEDAILAEEED